MNYEKFLYDFQNFIRLYHSLEYKQHKIFDLNLSEVHLLKIAEHNPNYTLVEYAEKLNISRSAISQVVNILEKKECVKKNKINKKSIVLELTTKGQIVCAKHDEEHKKIEKDEFQSIINTYQGNRTASENMVVKMKEATKDKVKPDISELQKEFELVEEAYKDLHTELEEMRAEYKTDEDILKKLDSALTERGAAAEEYGVINNLYTKLSGNVSGARMDIETFVQRKYLEKILISANKRFANMSAGQFELRTYGLEKAGEGKNRGLDLMVYSALNGKCRDVRTLSGGESFMAALSLALGMADQIQERSGAVNLEMMFVDEGFGTLDDNSRNQAVKILKNMAGGSKLIGIISHVSELKQEIEEQLVVTKDENGSRARWQLS